MFSLKRGRPSSSRPDACRDTIFHPVEDAPQGLREAVVVLAAAGSIPTAVRAAAEVVLMEALERKSTASFRDIMTATTELARHVLHADRGQTHDMRLRILDRLLPFFTDVSALPQRPKKKPGGGGGTPRKRGQPSL